MARRADDGSWRQVAWEGCRWLNTADFVSIKFIPGARTAKWTPSFEDHSFVDHGTGRSACTQYLQWLRDEGLRCGSDLSWATEDDVKIWTHVLDGEARLYFFVNGHISVQKLACLRIMLQRDREVFDQLANRPDKQLAKFGVCVKALDDTEPSDLECFWQRLAELVRITFPKVPAAVLADMTTGNLSSFEQFWSRNKLPQTDMILQSFGTPLPLPLSDQAKTQQTDDDGHVWHYNPCSAQMSVLPYRCIPAMRNLFRTLTAGKGRAVVAPDCAKLAPGGKITEMHADNPGEDALVRYQIILVRERKRLLRVLPASPNTNDFIGSMVTKVFGEGFSTIGQNPQLRALLEQFGVGAPEGSLGVLVFRAGTIHWETENPYPRTAETFRIYSGVQFVGEEDLARGTVTLDQLTKTAYMAENGCDLSSFNKGDNRTHPLFVNVKGLQHWQRRQGPNETVKWLLQATPEDQRTALSNLSDFDQQLRGLRPVDPEDVKDMEDMEDLDDDGQIDLEEDEMKELDSNEDDAWSIRPFDMDEGDEGDEE